MNAAIERSSEYGKISCLSKVYVAMQQHIQTLQCYFPLAEARKKTGF